MSKKLDQWFIKIQWLFITVAGIFLLVNGRNHDLIIIIWVISIVCNALWAKGHQAAQIEKSYFRLFAHYPIIGLVVRMLFIIAISLFVIGSVL